MAQIGTIKLQTDSGIVDVPVFEISDFPNSGSTIDALRVQTDSGIGAIPLTDPADATSPQEAIRVQTDSGIKAVTDSASAIPGSLVDDRWKLDEGSGTTGANSLQTVDLNLNNPAWQSNSKFTGGEAVGFNSDSHINTKSGIDINGSQGEVLFWADGLNNGGNNFADILRWGDGMNSSTKRTNNGIRLSFRAGGNDSFTCENLNSGGSPTAFGADGVVDVSTDDYFFALRVDGNTTGLRIYDASGTKQGDLSGSGTRDQSPSASFFIRNSTLGGVVDDVMAVQGSVLTESEEKEIANETTR